MSYSSQEEWGLQKGGNSADGEGEGCFRPGGPYGLYIKRRLTGPRREGLPTAGGKGLERQDVGQMAGSLRTDALGSFLASFSHFRGGLISFASLGRLLLSRNCFAIPPGPLTLFLSTLWMQRKTCGKPPCPFFTF